MRGSFENLFFAVKVCFSQIEGGLVLLRCVFRQRKPGDGLDKKACKPVEQEENHRKGPG